MKTIGLIGGTSWESTVVYYRLLNEGTRARRGGLHSAPILLASLDFAPLAEALAGAQWDRVANELIAAAKRLEAAGAEGLALCSNTMHRFAGPVVGAVGIPLVDLIDVTGAALVKRGSMRPLLLATRYTMEQDFYRAPLQRKFGIATLVPDEAARAALQRIIWEELCLGVLRPASKAVLLEMIASAERQGCDGVIFGCTEIGLLLSQADVASPVFDTTALHCDALLDFALASAPADIASASFATSSAA